MLLEPVMAMDAFQSSTQFLYNHKSEIDTIFNISWLHNEKQKSHKSHFVPAPVKCQCKCWLKETVGKKCHLKSLTNCVNTICFLMGSIYFQWVCLSLARGGGAGLFTSFPESDTNCLPRQRQSSIIVKTIRGPGETDINQLLQKGTRSEKLNNV